MKRQLAVAILLLSGMGRTAYAHRLDEYLQATLLTIEQDEVQASMRLIPGVSVAPAVIAGIDTNHDGILSEAEQQSYAQRVLNDLTLTCDGQSITPKLISATFPEIDQLRDGLGEIHIQFTGSLLRGGLRRSLVLKNHHQNPSSVYLVNATMPVDPNIHILTQKRNEEQSFYELDYEQTGAPAANSLWSNLRIHTNVAAFATLFHLGMHHIAEGTDHLLFLLALLLPAPLTAVRSRWVPSPNIRPGLIRVFQIVTAFTVGHSITLALAATGFLHVPSRPIEVLIAVSILISALHALRPIFPGKEAVMAAFFGLIHGLAFASTLNNLGLGWAERLTGVLAFNLGIETMQLLVVAVALPSLILMNRTSAYPYLRISAALFAALASLGWITERLLNINTAVDTIVNAVAQHAAAIAGALFLISLACSRTSATQDKKSAIPIQKFVLDGKSQ
jgi:hypothetical protein